MDKDNQILDILRLYEYSMSIGKTLSYYENCDSFLKLLLKRENLNACWIIGHHKGEYKKKFAIPIGNSIKKKIAIKLQRFLQEIEDFKIIKYRKEYKDLVTLSIDKGYVVIFKLQDHGYLFLYSKVRNEHSKKLKQILPVINKFANTLKACIAYENQKALLKTLEERNKELNNYAHIVSHDLKSPLRNIDALSSWLKEDHREHLNDDAKKYLDLINENISRMEDMVTGILEYSTIGAQGYRKEPVDISKTINDIVTHHVYVPEHITIKIHADFPIIQGDKHRLQQVFQNLIQNAVKYNDKNAGLIEIGFTIVNNKYEYFVKDNGIGIAEKYHKKIFNIFQKLENNKDSTGIGLSIVEKIVTNYGGYVKVFSEKGKGSSFVFTLS